MHGIYLHTRTSGTHAGPLRRRDDGGTSYIIYVDIILTTCVEYYTECVMSLIDPVTTGSQELEEELVPKSSLHNVFSPPKRIRKKKTKKTTYTVNKKKYTVFHTQLIVCVGARAHSGNHRLYTRCTGTVRSPRVPKKKRTDIYL